MFLEEIAQDYVRTARAKGVSNTRLLFTHVLKNGMISLITLVVAHLPLLTSFWVLLLIENFFAIPGLGNLLVGALHSGDHAVVRASVFLRCPALQVGFIATDICYALADPRIRLGSDTDVETKKAVSVGQALHSRSFAWACFSDPGRGSSSLAAAILA